MRRSEAKTIAEKVTVDELKQMFINARKGIKEWEQVSRVNKGMTKGTTFNILSKCGISDNTHILAKTNMVWEFGEWLPNYKKEETKKKSEVKPVHQEPKPLEGDIWDTL